MNLLHVVIQRILNVSVKEIILLTLNRYKTIIKCVVLGVLFTCVLIGLSSAPVFAASEDSPSSEVSSWLAPDLDSVQAKSLAEELSVKAAAAEYSTTDIYNLLYNAMRGEVYNSTYSLPRIASFTDRIAQILYGSGQSVPGTSLYSRVNSINSNISDLFHAVVDGSSSNIPVGPGIRQMLYGIDSGGDWETLFDTSQDSRDLLQLIYSSSQQIHGDLQNNSYYLSQLASSYNWLSYPCSYRGTFLNYDNSTLLTSNTQSREFYVDFNLTSFSSRPAVVRIFIPIYTQYSAYSGYPQFTISDITYQNYNVPIRLDTLDYFLESANNGSYLYLFGFNQNLNNITLRLHITSSTTLQFISSSSGSISYLPFDSDEYQQMKQAFYQAKAANAQGSMASDVNRLADYLADPDKIAAEEASQQVIDDTLDGFTGSGSAAAKTSDTGSMRNMSGSIQSGLSTGASAGNAASVFSNQTFWSWFTQQNSDQINNPYPAPVVNMNNRKSSGDEIVDFMFGHDQELSDLLGGSKW